MTTKRLILYFNNENGAYVAKLDFSIVTTKLKGSCIHGDLIDWFNSLRDFVDANYEPLSMLHCDTINTIMLYNNSDCCEFCSITPKIILFIKELCEFYCCKSSYFCFE